MTSDNDDLMPTGMSASKSEASKEFNEDGDKNKALGEVPDMIKEHQPHPELRPPWDVEDVERDAFNDKWQKAQKKHEQRAKRKDPFDKDDQGKDRNSGQSRR
tara:strand:+ start:1355 stop:1660 length:306 start_codon:yes stop_codon:yes gene_type:complete